MPPKPSYIRKPRKHDLSLFWRFVHCASWVFFFFFFSLEKCASWVRLSQAPSNHYLEIKFEEHWRFGDWLTFLHLDTFNQLEESFKWVLGSHEREVLVQRSFYIEEFIDLELQWVISVSTLGGIKLEYDYFIL